MKSICKKYADKFHNSEQKKNLRWIKNLRNAKNISRINNVEKISLTDPESRFIKNKKGRIELGYNTQLTVDYKKGIIIANDVCQDRNDSHQLKPQLKLVEQYCGQLKESTKICADSGYMNEKNIQLLKQKNLDPYIPERTDKNNIKKVKIRKKESIFHVSSFIYDEQKDVYICPENQILKYYYEFYDKKRSLIRRVYRGINCRDCKSNQQCTNRNDRTRQLMVNRLSPDRKCLNEKMSTAKAQRIFEERKYTVEPVIGNYKQNLKFREFITRGLNSVKNEFNLVCAAINLKKVWLYSNNTNS